MRQCPDNQVRHTVQVCGFLSRLEDTHLPGTCEFALNNLSLHDRCCRINCKNTAEHLIGIETACEKPVCKVLMPVQKSVHTSSFVIQKTTIPKRHRPLALSSSATSPNQCQSATNQLLNLGVEVVRLSADKILCYPSPSLTSGEHSIQIVSRPAPKNQLRLEPAVISHLHHLTSSFNHCSATPRQ